MVVFFNVCCWDDSQEMLESVPCHLGQTQGIQDIHYHRKLLATQCKAAKIKTPINLPLLRRGFPDTVSD